MNSHTEIIETARKVFIYFNSHNWDGLINEVFTSEVSNDDNSYPGAPPAATLPVARFIEGWKHAASLMPHAFHQMGNELVTINGDRAMVNAHVTGTHFNTETKGKWVVYSTFEISLTKLSAGWRVTALKQNFMFEEGKPELVM